MKSLNLKGIGASVGVAVAKVYLLKEPTLTINKWSVDNVDKEINLYVETIETAQKQLAKIREIAKQKLGEEKAEIFDAHIQILLDPEIKNEIEKIVREQRINVSYVTNEIFNKYHDIFLSMEDAYFKERAADIIDVKKRVLSIMLNTPLPNILDIDQEVILVAKDLTPSETALLNKKYVKGFVTDVGGRTSHAAIMARSMEIPAVLGTKTITSDVTNNDTIAIDGMTGEIAINPTNIQQWNDKIAQFENEQNELKKYIHVASKTKDGHEVLIEANIGNPVDSDLALQYGCEGIGLYRSEFLYMGNSDWPSEQEQFEGYKSVLEKQKNRLVVIRTLDIGGDKKLFYYTFPEEMNPFLGFRAIRFCLNRLDVFKTQLRALARASIYGKLAIMFPMIATIDEFVKAKNFALEVFAELKKEGHKISDDIQIGMMVEIPSAAILADQFAKHADFFSIGTNDLIQYSFACDRMSKEVAYLYQPNNPSLLRLIKSTIDGGHSNQRWVGMCGEMAGDILSIPLLLGLGLDAFSMSATSIPRARKIINNINYKDCVTLVQEAINCQTIDEVNQLVKKFLIAKKLA